MVSKLLCASSHNYVYIIIFKCVNLSKLKVQMESLQIWWQKLHISEKKENEGKEEEISEEFKSFLEAEVKSSFNILFKDLFDVLDGKTLPDVPEGDMEKDFSIADIRDAFDELGEAFDNMEIPDSLITSLREEFEAQKTDIGTPDEVSSVVENREEAKGKPRKEERSLKVEKPFANEEAKKKKREKSFKVPEKLGEAGLAPVQSDRSSRF